MPLPARQVIPRSEEGPLFGAVVERHPVASLTGSGILIGGLWGALAGNWLGAAKLGAALGGLALGIKGYQNGKELESWLKRSA